MERGGKILAGVTIAALVGCTGEGGKLEIRSTAVPPSAVAKPVPLRVAEGRGQLALGNVALALESFRKASREDPGSTDALLGVATCYDRMGRYDLSRRSYEAALAIAPADTQLLAAFASSLELQGLTQEALKVRQEIAARTAPLVVPKPVLAAAPVKVAAAPPAIVPAAVARPARPEPATPKPLHLVAATPVAAAAPAVVTKPVSAAAPGPAAPAPVRLAEAPRAVAAAAVALARTVPAVQPVAAPKVMQPVRSAEAALVSAAAPAAKPAPVSAPVPAAKPAPAASPAPVPAPAAVAAVTLPIGPSVTIKLPAPRSVAEAPAEPEAPKPETPKPAPATPGPAGPQAVASGGPRLERVSMAEIALVTTPAPLWRPTTVAQSGTSTTVRFVPLRQASAQPTRVRLLNAARVNRLAARTRGWLVAHGWRGLGIGNARSTRERSVVLYPAGKRALAQRISAQFGFAMAQRASGSDITVLLGRDAARVPALKPANV